MHDEKILKVLRSSPGEYVSSDELCKDAGISRAAIWKRMESLRAEGYEIEASPHLGYRLISSPDTLIPDEIKWKLKSRVFGSNILSYKKVDSTNDVAYSLAEKGMKEGTVILAEEQAAGKGRLGRKWSSPAKGGIYMSCILRPDIAPNEIPRITLFAAVAVAKAIREFSGLAPEIKWPNDILINGRKVVGILTEMKADQDAVNFVVVGIGVNVNTPSESLPRAATSLKEEFSRSGSVTDLSRIDLARKMLERLDIEYALLKKKGFSPIIEEWKALSNIIGSRVKVMTHSRTFEAQAHDIDQDGSLVVRRERGQMEKISSGDIIIME
jgi:BirA family transcriptional regulator, biotin operon repressor / biotin---[acetyl-CoA-carboxylase] ligase